MTEKRPLFRPEAVEYHAKARTGGRVLDLKERRTMWLFRGLLAVVGVALALAFTVQAETKAHGVATVDARGGSATLAIVDTRRIKPGQDVVVDLDGREIAGNVETVEAPVVTVALSGQAPPGARGEATVTISRASVAFVLLGWDD